MWVFYKENYIFINISKKNVVEVVCENYEKRAFKVIGYILAIQ